MSASDVLIIGAGISGLLCATELQRSGLNVRIVEKGRGFGGRMSTRRMAGGRLDHGAQFFTVRDKRFQAYVDGWLGAGIIREWFRHSPHDSNPNGYPRYCGVKGMTDVPKHLAASLQVERSEQINELSRETDAWVARSESGALYRADYLVVTAPAPRAINLLETTGLDYAGKSEAGLKNIRYSKGLATLAILDGPSKLPDKGLIQLFQSPLALIADNQVKGISPEVHAVTIHADADFAETHWDSVDEVRGPLMLEAAEPWLGNKVLEFNCHRWGFTTPLNPWNELHFTNPSIRLTLAGDSFGGARIEGAALSGLAAADAVAKLVKTSSRSSS